MQQGYTHNAGKHLIDAINENNLSTVTDLLSQRTAPNFLFNGLHPLNYAFHVGNSSMVRLLLKHGADLFYALTDEEEIADFRARIPPLCFLIEKFDNHFIHKCLDGLDVNKISDKNGSNLLHMVAIHGLRGNVIPCLVHLGLNPESENSLGYTPFLYAKIYKRHKILQMLQNGRAMTRYTDSMFNTALHSAARHGDKNLAIILKGMGAEIDQPNVFDETPLFEAVRRNDVAMTKLLINYGANVNAANYHGESLFCHAIVNNAFTCASLLISRGAKAKLENAFGEFPVWSDQRHSLSELTTFLVTQQA
jgi:ankyrin repeat protein